MAVLFVSHSSKDDAAAIILERWLRGRGFTDIFIDHSNIAGGEKWAQALRDATGTCRVVVCLVTQRWLASDECFAEFRAAWYMGRRIIPLFALEPTSAHSSERLAKVLAEDQGLNIFSCISAEGHLDLTRDPEIERRLEEGLRAAGALARIGLDPEAFEIDRKLRPTPFPGLASFGDADADAALFYGRSREIAETLEEIRTIRAKKDPRPFVILGASGAGKSSLLKAGIIPRLRREAPAWLPLHAFRPGADPLLNLSEALARSLDDFGKGEAHGAIRDRLFDAWSKAERNDTGLTPAGRAMLEAALESEGRALRVAAVRSGASILISVDQAEEMARAEGSSGDALADYLRAALAMTTTNWQLALTVRTDSFPELQNHYRFQGLEARGYDLRAIQVFRFDTVIEEPAKRYGVQVEHALVDALMEAAPKEDALPLLAFALQRLWRQYASTRKLSRDNYDKVGGLKWLVEDAAERALRGIAPEEDVPLPSGPPGKRLVDLAASTFVPSLAQINDQGAVIRCIAEWTNFNDEQQELLAKFDQWRLVVRKGEIGTVEVAHEALFREWTRLKGWLEPERVRLEALRSFQVDASTWDRNGRAAVFLNHRDKRLAEADGLLGISSYRKRLGTVEFDYIAACQQAALLVRRRSRRVQALIYTLFVGIITGLIGWINQAPIKEQVNWYVTMRPYMLSNVRPYVLTTAAERALKPGQRFRECTKDCPEMIVVPAGRFLMGSRSDEKDPNDDEKDRNDDEGPQHTVVFDKPFAVSKFEVTFDDWDACVAYGDCDSHISDAAWGRGQRPVINVTWDDAKRYVAWLSRMTGKNYRLLSEAEWEYAARAGSSSRFSFGDNDSKLGQYAWYAANSGSKTQEVGTKLPNAFGLYDMHGNVWEWVEDCEGPYTEETTDGAARTSGDCNRRIVRGGSWFHNPANLRSSLRLRQATDVRTRDLGFRLGRTLAP